MYFIKVQTLLKCLKKFDDLQRASWPSHGGSIKIEYRTWYLCFASGSCTFVEIPSKMPNFKLFAVRCELSPTIKEGTRVHPASTRRGS